MADIIIPLDEYKKLLRLANKTNHNTEQLQIELDYIKNITVDRLKSQIQFLKTELEIANSINRGLMVKKDILESIPKWIVNLFKPKYDVELMHRFLNDE